MEGAIVLVSFAAVGGFVWAVLARTQAYNWELAARLRRLAGPDLAARGGAAVPFGARFVLPMLRAVSRGFGRLLPGEMMRAVERRLLLAGRPWRIAAADFAALQALACGVLGGTALWIAAGAHVRTPEAGALAASLGLLGAYLPHFVVSARIAERRRAALDALPDAADLLVVCVEAGLGFDAALATLAEKTQGVLSEEVALAQAEMRVGRPRRQALQGLADRLAVPEVQAFVSAVQQSDHLGVPIADVLRSQAAFLRQVRRQRVEEASTRVPVRMLFPMVFFILPSLFLVILGPAVIGALATIRGTHAF